MVNLLAATSSFLGAIGPNALRLRAPTNADSVDLGERDPRAACSVLESLSFTHNTTILDATYYSEGLTKAFVEDVPLCTSTTLTFGEDDKTVPLCRVRFRIDTSETSNVTAEAWLPPSDNWNERFMSVGNAALNGCLDYQNLEYVSSLGFASVGSNNGHDGDTGQFFYHNPEVVNDFAYRAIHLQTLVGKEISNAFYNQTHKKSYYLGCSTGRRQGFQSAMLYPEDFDGIVAGSPAVNFNVLAGSDGMLSTYVGAPYGEGNASYIPQSSWHLVTQEILRQCDEIDGVKDGIITEPDLCHFRPEVLLCDSQSESTSCLSLAQVEALKKIYSPLYGSDGKILFPRYDPGAEYSNSSFLSIFSGDMFYIAQDWFRYVVYNDTTFNFTTFGVEDVEYAAEMDPGGISTYNGNMSAFEARGGKLLTFHGRSDELIPSGNSKALYNLVSDTMRLPSLDHFYRLFLAPGLDHCYSGQGSINFNQHFTALGPEATRDLPSHNILLALVDWVENGKAPGFIIGTSVVGKERKFCRYPWKSVWNEVTSEFDCVF